MLILPQSVVIQSVDRPGGAAITLLLLSQTILILKEYTDPGLRPRTVNVYGPNDGFILLAGTLPISSHASTVDVFDLICTMYDSIITRGACCLVWVEYQLDQLSVASDDVSDTTVGGSVIMGRTIHC